MLMHQLSSFSFDKVLLGLARLSLHSQVFLFGVVFDLADCFSDK